MRLHLLKGFDERYDDRIRGRLAALKPGFHTRMAIIEARRLGLTPFCVTIDETAGDYLPHLFGTAVYVVVRDTTMLPRVLPSLYARLTENI